MFEVKICGLTNGDDLQAAQDYGADYVGFVIYPKSPRGVTGMDVCRILDGVDLRARAVGVFVNEPVAEIEKIVSDCNLYAVQLHGDEIPADYSGLPRVLWRSVKIADGIVVPEPMEWAAERYVLDANVPGEYGGTGVTADWAQAAMLADKHPVMLAGGLTADNVADAVKAVLPAGVDTASGVEMEPGKKDHQKVKRFIEAAKNAATT
ncbi:hypothetical protein BVX97_03115 [bacterium E08(2017)]|nr:hypothetical protein BVX97_03115 [bacterium E08(2017)]